MNACIITRDSYDMTLHVDGNQSLESKSISRLTSYICRIDTFASRFFPLGDSFGQHWHCTLAFPISFNKNQMLTRKRRLELINHTKFCDWLLSISDICQLIGIDFYQQLLIFIRYRNYCRHVTSCLRTKQKGPKWVLTNLC